MVKAAPNYTNLAKRVVGLLPAEDRDLAGSELLGTIEASSRHGSKLDVRDVLSICRFVSNRWVRKLASINPGTTATLSLVVAAALTSILAYDLMRVASTVAQVDKTDIVGARLILEDRGLLDNARRLYAPFVVAIQIPIAAAFLLFGLINVRSGTSQHAGIWVVRGLVGIVAVSLLVVLASVNLIGEVSNIVIS